MGRLLLWTAGRAALERALPLYVAITIAASVVFGGNGLNAGTVAELSARSWPFRLGLHLGWALISLPAVKAIVATESTFVFRALPIARFHWLSWTAALLCVVELPWALLWLFAAGPTAALAETCWVLAASTLALSRLGPSSVSVGLVLLVVMLLQPSAGVWLSISLPAATLLTYDAWCRAPELPRAEPQAWVRGPAPLALALSYLAVLGRTAAAQLLRGLALVVAGASIAALQLRSSGGDARLTALTAMTPALLFALAGVVGPLLRIERELEWLTAYTRTSWVTKRFGPFAALSTLAIAAALSGMAVLEAMFPLAPTERWALLSEVSLAAALLAAIALGAARWAVRDSGRDAARLLLGVGIAGLAALLSLNWLGERGLLLWCPVAALAMLTRREAKPHRAQQLERTQMLEIDAVRKRLGTRRVLDGVSATCGAAEVVAVLGENGTGKSTLLRVIAGIVEPDAGTVTIRGAKLSQGGRAARRQLGYVPDAAQALPNLLVQELLTLVRALKALPRIASELEQRWSSRLGLDSLLGQHLSTLSFGQRKRALTAAALAGDPWLLVLDEPTNGLDPEASDSMLELIAERRAHGQATLLASNDAPFVERLGASVYRLESGQLHQNLKTV